MGKENRRGNQSRPRRKGRGIDLTRRNGEFNLGKYLVLGGKDKIFELLYATRKKREGDFGRGRVCGFWFSTEAPVAIPIDLRLRETRHRLLLGFWVRERERGKKLLGRKKRRRQKERRGKSWMGLIKKLSVRKVRESHNGFPRRGNRQNGTREEDERPRLKTV